MERGTEHGADPEGNGVAARAGMGVGRMPGNNRDEEVPRPLGEVVWSAVRRNALVAFALSLLVHFVTLMILGVISMPYGLSGGTPGPVGNGEIEVAVVSEAELDQLQAGAVDLKAPSVPEMVSADPVAKDLMSPDVGDEAGSSLGEPTDIGTISGGGDIGGIGEGMGGTGGGSGASFFGVEARGNRFAFIVDISGSMGDGEKMPSLKRELNASVNGMRETAQFVVVPFSDQSYPLGGKAAWKDSTQSSKKWAKALIDALQPGGGTSPASSFEMVLRLRPRADAVYFMTDGQFDPSLADLIREMGKTVKVPIHCLCFGSKDSEELMKLIAKESGGTYHFIP